MILKPALALGTTIGTAEIEDDAVTAAKLADTAVTPGAYTYSSVTVDQQGRLTAASSGATPYVPGGAIVSIADGGTESSTAGGARTALGLAIGSDVQAWDADLDALAASGSSGTGAFARVGSPTLTTPTIGSFENATHMHANAAGGGQLTTAAMSDYTEWTTPTFAAGNFTANGAMTWTVESGDVGTYAYRRHGKHLQVVFALNTTSVGGTPNTDLRVAIPGGFVAAKTVYGFGQLFENSVHVNAYSMVAAGVAYITVSKFNSVVYLAATNTTYVFGNISFEIQ